MAVVAETTDEEHHIEKAFAKSNGSDKTKDGGENIGRHRSRKTQMMMQEVLHMLCRRL